MRSGLILAAVVLTAFVVQGCAVGSMGGMGSMDGMDGMGRMGNQSVGRGNAPPPSLGAAEVLILAGDLYFQPDVLHVTAGETINLTLDNQGAAFHDFTIGDLGFAVVADPGEQSSGALTVAASGRYEYTCTVPGHAQAGMVGTLIVE